MAIQYLSQLDKTKLKGQKVVARFDFNIPLNEKKEITDTTRIDMALPTIKDLLAAGVSKLILMSHLGRPKGKVNKDLSLEPVATYLAEELGVDVILTENATDEGNFDLLKLPTTKILLLENLRFHVEEEKNDKDFAEKLASYGDWYLNDAFGCAHRKHASVYQIIEFFERRTLAGHLIQKEVEALKRVVEDFEKPFVAIIGGAKVSDKIKTIENFLITADSILIGGAMAYPFLRAKGNQVGKSLCSEEDVKLAASLLKRDRSGKIQLPSDHIVSTSPDGDAQSVSSKDIPDDLMGLDIGPETCRNYRTHVLNAKTVLWNGPMGFFERTQFAEGTMHMAQSLAQSSAFTVVGGGDSVSAIKKSGLAADIDHVSTGGGASLEFIQEGTLPGIQALRFGVKS